MGISDGCGPWRRRFEDRSLNDLAAAAAMLDMIVEEARASMDRLKNDPEEVQRRLDAWREEQRRRLIIEDLKPPPPTPRPRNE
jgi:hypothetical protein